MSLSYQLIALADVKPGMVLSDVLLDKQGQVLLAQGAVLTEATIALLPRHGIDMLPILRDGGGGNEADAPSQDNAAIQARLDHLFRHNDRDDHNDWATGLLRRYVEDFRLGREIEQ